MKTDYTALESRFVRLETLAEHHRDGLRAACEADTDIWAALYPYSMIGERFDLFWDSAVNPGAGRVRHTVVSSALADEWPADRVPLIAARVTVLETFGAHPAAHDRHGLPTHPD